MSTQAEFITNEKVVCQAEVGIVLVAYNRARFIRQTLDSIVRQSYPHFEVLICDDSSYRRNRGCLPGVCRAG